MRIVIVIDASSGMGREVVIQTTDRFRGIDEVWTIAGRKGRLKELGSHVPVTLRCFGLDVVDFGDLKVLEMALKENKPGVKLLINSAGYGKIGNVGDVYLEDGTGMIQVNRQALCTMTCMVPPYMGKNSHILQSVSSAVSLSQPRPAIYAATRSFVLSYGRALGAELKNRGIFVTAVYPGPAKTESFDVAEMTGHTPLYKRLVTADPGKVVRLALRGSMMGEPLFIYRFAMKGSYVLSKILPYSRFLYLMTHMKF